MKSSLIAGVTGQLTTRVGAGNTIALGGVAEATVFSTPSMVKLMELAAKEALADHLDPGEESVGVDVQITHSSATPPRNEVVADAVVTSVEKNVVSFDVSARDKWGEIGRGTHRRAVIETAKFAQRLAQKKPQATSRAAGSETIPSTRWIDCQRSKGLLKLTLNRPQKRNAIHAEMTTELESLVDWLDGCGSAVRVVILQGAGETFCAGDDVGDLTHDVEAMRRLSLRRGLLYQRMTELPQILMAAVDGAALGGGLVLACSCDFRIVTQRSRFALPEVSLGWPPNYGMGIVQSLVGRGNALELAILGQTIGARRAAEIGLANQVVAPAQLEPTVGQLVERIESLSPDALAATKRLLAPGVDWSDQSASDEFACCLKTNAAKASIDRFRS